MSVGFVGDLSPKKAADLVVERILRFMKDKQIYRVSAVEPFEMDSTAILTFYKWAHLNPRLAIRGRHRLGRGTYLWIQVPCTETKY